MIYCHNCDLHHYKYELINDCCPSCKRKDRLEKIKRKSQKPSYPYDYVSPSEDTGR